MESDSDDDEDTSSSPKAKTKAAPAPSPPKKSVIDSDSEDDETSSSPKVKATTRAAAAAPAGRSTPDWLKDSDAAPSGTQQRESPAADPSLWESAEPSPWDKKEQKQKPASPKKKAASSDSESSGSISDDESSSRAKPKISSKKKKPKDSSDSYESSDSDSSTPPNKKAVAEEKKSDKTPAKKSTAVPPLKCVSCGMEEDFVSEGMQKCIRCNQVPYCSMDCLKWHWESGGHKKDCTGLSEAERKQLVEESRVPMADDSNQSIDPFKSNPDDMGAPQSQEGIFAALARAKEEAGGGGPPPVPPKPVTPKALTNDKCKACGMEEEYVPDGMIKCPKCLDVSYCSSDCMKWHWDSGGHKAACSGISESQRRQPERVSMVDDSVMSIDPFKSNPDDVDAPQSQECIFAALTRAREEASGGGSQPAASKNPTPRALTNDKCKACGMEEEYVPDGMIKCGKCLDVSYCSSDCLKWHWESGGHMKACSGISESQRRQPERVSMVDDSVMSIDPFQSNSDDVDTPQSQEGIFAALTRAREEAAGGGSAPAGPKSGPVKCQACGMEEEYVPDGMIKCGKCLDVSYCSGDCLKWHWESGGHMKACSGISESQRRQPERVSMVDDSVMSIDPFQSHPDDVDAPQSQDGIFAALARAREEAAPAPKAVVASLPPEKCIACGMESEFVPEGMLKCSKCSNVSYCSPDCMEWHWKSGGHKNECKGLSPGTRRKLKTINEIAATLNDSDDSIKAFDTNAQGVQVPQSHEGILAALAKSRAETSSAPSNTASASPLQPKSSPTSNIPLDKCHACGMDAEFVSEGMQKCAKCFEIPYCSLDCMSWDWDKGGHKDKCAGAFQSERSQTNQRLVPSPPKFGYAPPSPKDLPKLTKLASKAPAPESKCKACAMEAEFVPEGMTNCSKCQQVLYCSKECMEWDWDSGGHRHMCKGATASDRAKGGINKADSDDGSLEAFGGDENDDGAPDSKEGVLAALAKARAESTGKTKGVDPPLACPPNVKSNPSLRDQITGGNDVAQERAQERAKKSQPPPANYDVSMLKLELERVKRQYNDALLSKASLERDLKNTARSSAPQPPPQSGNGFREAVGNFLNRLERLLEEAERGDSMLHFQPLRQKQLDALRQGGLEESAIELENTIQSLLARTNQSAVPVRLSSAQNTRGVGSDGPDRGKNALMRELNSKWDEIIAESEALRAQLDKANGDREQLRYANEASVKLVQEKEALLSKVCGTIVDLEKEVSRMVEEQRSLEAENKSLRAMLDRASNEQEQLREAKQASDRLLLEKEDLLSKLCAAVSDLEAEVSRIDREKQALKDELDSTKFVLAKHQQARQRLEQSFNDAETEIVGLRGHLRQMDTDAEAFASRSGKLAQPSDRVAKKRALDIPGQYFPSSRPMYSPQQPATGNTEINVPQSRPSQAYWDDKSLFGVKGLPSQRQDEVGRAIRERVGVAPSLRLPGRVGGAAAPMPHLRATSSQQRDDAREPKGGRPVEDYTKPLKSRSPWRPQPVYHSARSYDEAPRLGESAFRETASVPTRAGFAKPAGNAQNIFQPRTTLGQSRTNSNEEPLFLARGNPMSSGHDTSLALTPTEQRMAYIQQRIAEAVQSAKHNVTSVQGHPSGSFDRGALRPRYSSQPNRVAPQTRDPTILYQDQSVFRLPTGAAAQPKSSALPQQQHLQQSASTPLRSGGGPVASQGPPPSSSRNQPIPYRQPKPQPQQQPRQYQGGLGVPMSQRTRLDPPTTAGDQRYYVRKQQPPSLPQSLYSKHSTNSQPQYSQRSAPAPRPRYAVHHVDPKNLQRVRDERWKSVLSSSKVLS